MISRSAIDSMSPKERAQYGAAVAKGAAFDAVRDLWDRRKAEGWTQAKLANAIGVDEGWLSKQFVGPRNWTMETYGMLVEGLDGEPEILAHAVEEIADLRNHDAYAEYEESPVVRVTRKTALTNTTPVANASLLTRTLGPTFVDFFGGQSGAVLPVVVGQE
jgi:hypothetical protein